MADNRVQGPGVLDAIAANMRIMELQKSPRGKYLRCCREFYQGHQHDHQRRDWNGGSRDPGTHYMMERLKPQGWVPTNAGFQVPHGARKPHAHVPLPRQIVNRFTEMLLGQGRYPGIHVPSDADTEAYLKAIFEESHCWDTLVEARDLAGSCGASAVLLRVQDGTPTSEVLCTYDLHVVKWADRPWWEPDTVVEQRLVERQVPNKDTGRMESIRLWRTRMWTPTHAVLFKDVEERHDGKIPQDGEPVEHKAGRCPVVWLQNTRSTTSPDGCPDYEGVEHLLDELDRQQSQALKATRANTDPTIVKKDEERYHRREQVLRKGTGNVIKVGPTGDAKYLEIQGNSLTLAWKAIGEVQHQILQTVECVIVTPENAGNYKSGEALQMLWRSMEAKSNRLRVGLAQAIRQVCRIWITLGDALGVGNLEDEKPKGIALPPRVEDPEPPEPEEPAAPPEPGMPPVPHPEPEPEELEPVLSTHVVGRGRHTEIKWPPYWTPTPMQLQALSAAMQTATGGKASISQETSIEVMAQFLGNDAGDEKDRVDQEKKAGMAMFEGSLGFGEGAEEGAEEPETEPGKEQAPGAGTNAGGGSEEGGGEEG